MSSLGPRICGRTKTFELHKANGYSGRRHNHWSLHQEKYISKLMPTKTVDPMDQDQGCPLELIKSRPKYEVHRS